MALTGVSKPMMGELRMLPSCEEKGEEAKLFDSFPELSGMDQGEELAKREYSPLGCATGISTRRITGSPSRFSGTKVSVLSGFGVPSA